MFDLSVDHQLQIKLFTWEKYFQVKQRKPYGSKKKKDPNAPTAAISAYTFFFRETQPTIKSQNPGNSLKFTAILAKIIVFKTAS